MIIIPFSVMELSQFPLEVLEIVARFLSPEDLAACSAVNSLWRAAFNLDLFWRKHCNPDIVGYLNKSCGLLEPPFKKPTSVETLEPLCIWRIHHMRKAQLLRNWSKGRYYCQRIHVQSPVINCTLGTDSKGTHWLVVNLGDRTEVWDVQNTPEYHATFTNVTEAPNYLQVVGDKLIVVDFYYFVRVFNLNLPTLGFMPGSMFFYTDAESYFRDLSDNDDVTVIRNRLRSCFEQGHVIFVTENWLVGYSSNVQSPKDLFLHIWNISTESKFSEETVLSALQDRVRIESCNVYITLDDKTKKLLCSLYFFDKNISKLVLYHFKLKKFTDFCLNISGKVDWCVISEGLIVTSHLLHQLHIYSTETGNLVHILDTNTRIFFGPHTDLQYQIMGDYVIQPSRESVKVVNIRNHWDSLMLHFYSVYKVLAIPPKFIAVSARPYALSNRMILEVWNVKEKIHIFDHTIAETECTAYHIVHPLVTKTAVALGKTIKLLSFW